ncbi:MAG: hypothetical protein JSR47_21185 [Proteobacteria bacterium]|nr:hypothetical protein [Pseudomonadota bacterium]
MSSPRLSLLLLPIVLGLPLLTGACGAPVAVAAVSYGADGVSLMETGKTGTDHLASMVSKKDCALWRVFRNQTVCRERDGKTDPYDVSYDEPFRQPTEGGAVEYAPPPHAAPDAPATSWDSTAYAKPATQAVPTTAVADAPSAAPTPEPVAEAAPAPEPAPPVQTAHKARHKKAKPVAARKPSPSQVASSR